MSIIERASRVMPGGVSSPVRAFTGVGGDPVFVRSAEGAYLEGEDGKRYIDYIGGYGPHILGHGHPEIVAAVRAAAGRGTAFGAPTVAEVDLAELLCSALAGDGHGAAGQQRHRSDHVGPAPGARRHRPRPVRQVRRLLPRPRRRLPGRRRLRRRDHRPPVLARRARAGHRRHPGRPLQRPGRGPRPCSSATRGRSRRSSSRRSPATWAWSSRSRASSRGCAPCAPSTARCWSSTR